MDSHNKDFKAKQANMATINKYKYKGKEQSFCLQVLSLPTDEKKEYGLATVKQLLGVLI